ncbi:MAG: MFS transporter [Planctomycetota bacterium]|jgi:MFS family permease
MVLGEVMRGAKARVLLFCWLGWAFDFYDLILFAFVKLAVQQDLGIDVAQLAWIEGATLGASAIGGFAFGRMADRVGRRRALSTSILFFSAGALCTGLADGVGTLLCARVLTGLGVGGEWGVGHAAVAEAYPERLRGRAAGLLQAATPVGMGLAALVGCFVAPSVGWRAAYVASALPALLVLMARWAMPGDGDERVGARVRPGLDMLRGALLRPSLVLFTVLALHMTGFWCCFAWLPSALLKDGGFSLGFVGTFHVSLALVHVFADVAFGWCADRFGRRTVFVAFSALFALGLSAMGLGFERLADDFVLFAFVLATVGLGAGTWSAFGVFFAELYPRGVRATAASGLYNLSRGVQLFTLPMMGFLFASTGTYAVALWVGVATALLSALTLVALPRSATSEAEAVASAAR